MVTLEVDMPLTEFTSRHGLAVISGGMCFSTIGISALSLLVPLNGVELAVSPFIIGSVVAAAHVPPLFFAIRVGGLVDSVGHGKMYGLGAAGLALTPLLIVAWPSLAVLVLVQMLSGFFHMATTVASQAFVSGLAGSRQQNMGIFTSLLSTGQLIGPLVAGLVLDVTGFRTAYAMVSIAFSLNLFIAVLLVRSGLAPSPDRGRRTTPTATTLRNNLRSPGIQVALLASSGIFAGTTVYQTFLPVLLSDRGVTATMIGLLLSVRALVAVVVRPLITGFVRLLRGQDIALIVTMVLVAIGTGLSGAVAPAWALLALAMAVGVGMGVGIPLSVVMIATYVEQRGLGLALGLRLFTNRLAQLSAALGIGKVVTLAGYGGGFLLIAISVLAAAWLATARVRVLRSPDSGPAAQPSHDS